MTKRFKQVKIVIVLPAYNAERTLQNIYKQIPNKNRLTILLVDDGSKDATVKVAKRLKIPTIVHKKNLGYGANQKTCYDQALKLGADFVIMLHPDGQYDPKDLPLFIDALKKGQADLVLGSRFLNNGHCATPFYKILSIKLLTLLFNLIVGTKLSELNTGYRGYSRKILETIPYHKNGQGYIFDPQFILQAVFFGFRISEVPVTKDYNPEAISPDFYTSIHHGLENLFLLLEYMLHRAKLKQADILK